MADDIILNPGAGGATLATDEIGGRHFELVKINKGADGVDGGVVTVANPFPVLSSCSLSTITSVPANTSDTLLKIANVNRKGMIIVNDSTASVLKVLLGTGVASPSNFSVTLTAGEEWEIPFGYTGEVRGIWSIAMGSARITELT